MEIDLVSVFYLIFYFLLVSGRLPILTEIMFTVLFTGTKLLS